MNNTSQKQQKSEREQRWRSDDDMNVFPKPSPFPFLLLILILGLFVVGAGVFIFLPTNEQQGGGQTNSAVGTATDPTTSTGSQPITEGTRQDGSVSIKSYPIADVNADMMSPNADPQGNIWFGDMTNNRLFRLNQASGKIVSWSLPQNQTGIMDALSDSQGNVWFAEQNSNSIGRFDAQKQQFQRFPLPKTQGQGLSPQDLSFDAKGMLWFTAIGSGQLGRLDPSTGQVHLWTLPQADGAPLYPSSLTIDSTGQIWMGMLAGGSIVRFDPQNTQFAVSKLADPQTEVSAFAHERNGQIWFAELQTGKIGSIDVKTRQVTEYQVPSATKNPTTDTTPTFTGIATSAQGEVWIASPNNASIIRYQPQSRTFTAITLSIAQSQPYYLTFDAQNHVWFTSSGDASSSYVGEIDPTRVTSTSAK